MSSYTRLQDRDEQEHGITASLAPSNSALIRDWVAKLRRSTNGNLGDRPNYYVTHPLSLLTTSTPQNFTLGTGLSIYTSTLLPAIESATREIILVTCFWAASPTLSALVASLRRLSATVLRDGRERVKVRMCFSSSSLLQKLFHTSSLRGRVWSPEEWMKLGLPREDELPGLDVSVKSMFVRPFSVMHPKFLVVDGSRVWVPSCNVSWEEWFEGCIEIKGDVVQQFTRFYDAFWESEEEKINFDIDLPTNIHPPGSAAAWPSAPSSTFEHNPSLSPASSSTPLISTTSISTLFLPSPHHSSLILSFPFLSPFLPSSLSPPPTPLNTFLLLALSHAQKSIYIQTPNLTSPSVLSAISAALQRGVHVEILTSERLMLLEQLVTAMTTTTRCIKQLIKTHSTQLQSTQPPPSPFETDLEAGGGGQQQRRRTIGELRISYYQPRPNAGPGEPVQSHLKLTVVDQEVVVLGSGNMDRASWFTSQELGVAFFSEEMARRVRRDVDGSLQGRKKVVYDSAE
ncbi:hypothetical protein LTS18_005065 [Coniosporium uncinatum]|uniref:Uncharacterized protein n=1 Tax=Coniosporium uncinatum TaxID=93489 RepID=A0ACC3DRI8_9PEZI|nr:hypothetical protein LTS18_005065 [Coniosporium uncinatum]